MAYQSLYRKYRPQTFADVVGQGHVVRTLQNALQSGRIAHGFLFTGTRGTAKTTVARLLAKCLNCESQAHPVAEPCNACEACLAIAAGTCIDVVEMDAASHRGVADIEEVRKAVGFGPMQFRNKVFIIDEAHQLSSDAKDAFLKTLEEPPPGVVFILATTEPQSIPITIRSRCQQFDFKRGSVADIAGRLATVAAGEGVAIAPDALHRIARAAEGSYRDSLSLLEQVLAFCEGNVEADHVDMVLGALGADSLGRLTEAMRTADAASALALAAELTDSGKEVRTVLRTLAAHLRDLLLIRAGADAAAAGISADDFPRLRSVAQAFTTDSLLAAIDTVNSAISDLRWNNQHRLLLEITFLKLAHPPAPTTTAVSSVAAAAAVPAAPARTSSPAPTNSAPTNPAPEAPAQRPIVTQSDASPALTSPAGMAVPAAPGEFLDNDNEGQPEEPENDGMRLFDPPPAPAASSGTVPASSELQLDEPESGDAPGFTLDDVHRVWPLFLEEAGKYSKQAQVFLNAAVPTSADSGVVIITFSNRANCEMMQQPKQTEFVRRMLGRALGRPGGHVPVRLEVDTALSPPAPPRAQRNQRPRHDALAALDAHEADPVAQVQASSAPATAEPVANETHRRPSPPPTSSPEPEPPASPLSDHPLVQDILSTFGGSIIDP